MSLQQIIDRRLSGKNKSIGNRERFLRRHKDQIREAVKRAIDGGQRNAAGIVKRFAIGRHGEVRRINQRERTIARRDRGENPAQRIVNAAQIVWRGRGLDGRRSQRDIVVPGVSVGSHFFNASQSRSTSRSVDATPKSTPLTGAKLVAPPYAVAEKREIHDIHGVGQILHRAIYRRACRDVMEHALQHRLARVGSAIRLIHSLLHPFVSAHILVNFYAEAAARSRL